VFVVVALVGTVVVVVVEDVGVVAAAAAGVNVGVNVGSIAAAVKSAGVACAVLVSEVPVAVAVAIACTCKFVKVSIKGEHMSPLASLFLSSLPGPPSSPPMTADPSAAWALCRSAGALGLAVACGCSLAPEINEMSSCCKALLVWRMLNLSSLLGGAELAYMSLEVRSQERAGVRDVIVGTYSLVRNRAGRRQLRQGR